MERLVRPRLGTATIYVHRSKLGINKDPVAVVRQLILSFDNAFVVMISEAQVPGGDSIYYGTPGVTRN